MLLGGGLLRVGFIGRIIRGFFTQFKKKTKKFRQQVRKIIRTVTLSEMSMQLFLPRQKLSGAFSRIGVLNREREYLALLSYPLALFFFGNRGGLVYELDIESGKLLRNFYVGSPLTPKVSLWNNSLYVGEGVHDLHHARVYKFDLKTGAYVGSYQTKGHIEAQSVISEFNSKALMFVPAGADGLHAVDPTNMQGAWKVNHGHVDSAVAANDGLVFMGTGRERDDDKKNKCYATALDFNTGETKWKHELPGSSWIVPTVLKNDVCFVIGEVYFYQERGHVLCFDQKTGAHKAAFNLDEPIVAIPAVVGNDLFVSTVNGTLCSYDLETRTQNWCNKGNVDGTAYAGPSYDPKRNVIVYPTYKEGIKVFHPKTGALLGAWSPKQDEGEWVKTYANANLLGDRWIFSDYVSSVRAVKASEVDTQIKKFVQK